MTSPAQTQQPNALALMKKDVVDVVEQKVRDFQQSGQLALPANYSAENAIKSAWLTLQTAKDKDDRLVLQVCTRDSIANSLLDMVVQGLNPAKKQCYFIAYGATLTCQRSYFGDMALVKQVRPEADIYYGVVYKGDDFEYAVERGRRRITKHIQRIENIKPENITAAYCVIEGENDLLHTEIMTITDIHRSWQQSKTYKENGNGVHQKFPDQMAIRTVIRRACKAIINSSSDDYLLLKERVNHSDEDGAEADIEAEAAEHANGEVIDVEAGEAEIMDEAAAAPEPAPTTPQPSASSRSGPGF